MACGLEFAVEDDHGIALGRTGPAPWRGHFIRVVIYPHREQVQSGRSPSATKSLFSCVAKRKVTKREGHPAYAPCGHPARKVRVRVTGFVDSTSCADAKLACIHAGHPAGFSSHPPAASEGLRVEQRTIVVRTR